MTLGTTVTTLRDPQEHEGRFSSVGAMAYMKTHEQTIAARLHANGQDALAIGLAGTPGYLAESKLVTGAISEGAFIGAVRASPPR